MVVLRILAQHQRVVASVVEAIIRVPLSILAKVARQAIVVCAEILCPAQPEARKHETAQVQVVVIGIHVACLESHPRSCGVIPSAADDAEAHIVGGLVGNTTVYFVGVLAAAAVIVTILVVGAAVAALLLLLLLRRTVSFELSLYSAVCGSAATSDAEPAEV